MKTIIISNGSKWAGESPDSIEKLLEVLKEETLDGDGFEKTCGGFIHRPGTQKLLPEYRNNKELVERNNTCFHFFGNFVEVSHVFNIHSSDPVVVQRLSDAIAENIQRPEYKKYMEEHEDRRKVLEEMSRKNSKR